MTPALLLLFALFCKPVDQPLAGNSVIAAIAFEKTFGMPLYGIDGEGSVGAAFNDLFVPLYRNKSVTKTVQCLVVGAVDMAVLTINIVEIGARLGADGMDGVDPVDVGVSLAVLDESAAQSDVYQLMATADAEDRFAGRDEGGGKMQFLFVPGGVDAKTGDILLAVAGGINVSAAGEEQAVADDGIGFFGSVTDVDAGE